MKFFISQAMKGRGEFEILDERLACEKAIQEEYPDAEILQSYFKDFVEDDKWTPTQKRVKYLAKSIEMLADADVVCFIRSTGEYTPAGVACEHEVAQRYHLLTIGFNPEDGELTTDYVY